ncbi:ThiF family adenylyltransferase [Haloarcula amylovorans]|uniref:ThiF family adenylyltransferase n=1 Tax=Haloarcula amylovorans TaxID=2562280 RepID=UPI001076222F|nr:ThiF family adenylyltransferase [Halomicroarcula amylolytica]
MLPTEIEAGIASVGELDNVEILEDPCFIDSDSKWVLKIRLSPDDINSDSSIPGKTDWFVHISSSYPAGSITIYPSAQNSITSTYPHQRLNVRGDTDNPWRQGNICVARYGFSLNQSGATGEPHSAENRLSWHLQRALQWLSKASNGELRNPDEPFEIPEFNTKTGDHPQVAFEETRESLDQWMNCVGARGTVELTQLSLSSDIVVTESFEHEEVGQVTESDWGEFVDEHRTSSHTGAWVFLEEVPFRTPWEPPETWQDLAQILGSTSIDPYELLAEIRPILEDESLKLLLVGFPIPETIAGDPVVVHWQPIEIKDFEDPTDYGGHRPTERGREFAARFGKRGADVQWLKSENWAHEQLSRRGAFSDWFWDKNVLLIGAGALGSTVAENLVRAGCQNLIVVDGEPVEIGNMARHTLTLEHLGENKASALAKRLRKISPHVEAVSIDEDFPPDDRMEKIDSADIIIDCTASRTVRRALNERQWENPVLFSSASMGRRGNRLFNFIAFSHSFPYEDYQEVMRAWRLKEQIEWDDENDAVPERVGCWHPASVIRMDRVMTWAGTISRFLSKSLEIGRGGFEFTVLETNDEDSLPQVTEADRPFKDVKTFEAEKSQAQVQLPQECYSAMKDRARQSHPCETGGIVAGADIEETTALVVNARDPPRDSIEEPTRFLRGTEKVDEWLKNARDSMGIHYLGEWHYHPSSAPELSSDDIDSMKEITFNKDYACKNPLLFVLGGDESAGYTMNVYLFYQDGDWEKLTTLDDGSASNGGAKK